MANPSKAKGTVFETQVVRYLREHGFPHAERRALNGNVDLGDITGTPGIVWECKAHATVTDGLIAEWQAETAREMKNANASLGILVVKRPRKAVEASHAFFRGEWGYWYSQPFGECVERLRTCGWGEGLVAS